MPRYLAKCFWWSVRMFPEETSIWTGGLSVCGPPHSVRIQCRWASLDPLSTHIEQKVEEGLNSLSAWLWAGALIFWCPLYSWFSGLQTWPGTYASGFQATPPAFLGLQFADGRLWNFSSFFHNHVSQFLIINLSISRESYIKIDLDLDTSCWVLFLWRTLMNNYPLKGEYKKFKYKLCLKISASKCYLDSIRLNILKLWRCTHFHTYLKCPKWMHLSC